MKRIFLITATALALTAPLAQAEGTGQNLVVRIGPAESDESDVKWVRTGTITCYVGPVRNWVVWDHATSWPSSMTQVEANAVCRQNAAQKY